jgi:acyl-CoA synthetase (AMP-forming)/AMP-acid ligase II
MDDDRLPDQRRHADLSGFTLPALLAELSRSRADSEVVVCRGDRYTYAQLDDRVRRLATVLSGLGVGPGDRVAWIGKNCHRIVELFFACGFVGAMFCPLNWRLSDVELRGVSEDLSPAAVFDDGTLANGWVGGDHKLSSMSRQEYESQLVSVVPTVLPVGRGSDPVIILYTAAFTGVPCGAMLTHENLCLQGMAVGPIQGFDDSTCYLASSPLFHIAAWMGVLPTLQCGGRLVMAPDASPSNVCQLISVERCTLGFILPPTIDAVNEISDLDEYDLSSFRSTVRDGPWGHKTSPDESPWGRRPGGYGQTEATGVVAFNALGGRERASMRPSAPVSIQIIDETGQQVGVGDVGEIAIGGPLVGAGYWRQDKLNSERRRDGWWLTRDLGRRNSDGSFVFVGPKLRLMKSGMENIYPAEVEASLSAHPDVAEAAVIGVPDDRWVQSIVAIVRLRDNARVTESELIAYCRGSIASYKKPRRIEFVTEPIPRMGQNFDYAALDAQFGGGGYPGSG